MSVIRNHKIIIFFSLTKKTIPFFIVLINKRTAPITILTNDVTTN